MNSSSIRAFRRPLLREVITALLFASLLLQSATAVAPAWWATRGVLTPGAAADDYAVANVGQLKTIAQKAALEMEDTLPGGAGADINALIDSWTALSVTGTTRDDYAALNLGQLKSVAQLFYDRLAEAYVRPAGSYPWGAAGSTADDYALANLGQLKTVFAFDMVPADANHNSIPDAWELQMFGNLNQLATDDLDNDGLSNLAEWQARTRPDNEDTDGDGFSDKVERDAGFNPVASSSNPETTQGTTHWEWTGENYFRAEHVVVNYGTNPEGQQVWHVNKFIELPNDIRTNYDVVTGTKPAFPPLPPVPTHDEFYFPYWYDFWRGTVYNITKYQETDEYAEHRMFGGGLSRVRVSSDYPSLRARTYYLMVEKASRAVNTNDDFEPEDASVMAVTIPATCTQSANVELTTQGEAGKDRRMVAYPMGSIVPDESMSDPLLAGGLAPPMFMSMAVSGITAFNNPIRGDEIESVLPNGDKHFVTPQKTPEIPQDYVILRAKDVASSDLGPNGKWEWHFHNPDDPNDTACTVWNEDDPLRFNVLRDKPRHVIVSIGPKGGSPAADKVKMHIWVVWTKITPEFRFTNELPAQVIRGKSGRNPQEFGTYFKYGTKQVQQSILGFTQTLGVKNGLVFKFQILPPSVVSNAPNADIPDLTGAADDSAQNNRVPGYNKAHATNQNDKADSAIFKWDVSRQMQITVKNPGGILKSELEKEWPAKYCEKQPGTKPSGTFPDQVPVPFPSGKLSDVEGNDDPLATVAGTGDEDDNPYEERRLANDALNHDVGYLSSVDSPAQGALEKWGKQEGDKIGIGLSFIEFARLQLWDKKRKTGRVWFRISDPTEGQWHHDTRLEFNILNRWMDDATNGSSSGF